MTTPIDQDAERKRIIRQRNRVMGLLLGAMAVLFFLISIARIGG